MEPINFPEIAIGYGSPGILALSFLQSQKRHFVYIGDQPPNKATLAIPQTETTNVPANKTLEVSTAPPSMLNNTNQDTPASSNQSQTMSIKADLMLPDVTSQNQSQELDPCGSYDHLMSTWEIGGIGNQMSMYASLLVVASMSGYTPRISEVNSRILSLISRTYPDSPNVSYTMLQKMFNFLAIPFPGISMRHDTLAAKQCEPKYGI